MSPPNLARAGVLLKSHLHLTDEKLPQAHREARIPLGVSVKTKLPHFGVGSVDGKACVFDVPGAGAGAAGSRTLRNAHACAQTVSRGCVYSRLDHARSWRLWIFGQSLTATPEKTAPRIAWSFGHIYQYSPETSLEPAGNPARCSLNVQGVT